MRFWQRGSYGKGECSGWWLVPGSDRLAICSEPSGSRTSNTSTIMEGSDAPIMLRTLACMWCDRRVVVAGCENNKQQTRRSIGAYLGCQHFEGIEDVLHVGRGEEIGQRACSLLSAGAVLPSCAQLAHEEARRGERQVLRVSKPIGRTWSGTTTRHTARTTRHETRRRVTRKGACTFRGVCEGHRLLEWRRAARRVRAPSLVARACPV